jgi:hypothetical protein
LRCRASRSFDRSCEPLLLSGPATSYRFWRINPDPYERSIAARDGVRSVGKQFVDTCRQGKDFDVRRARYAPNIVSVEGDGKETAGRQPVIKKSEDWVSNKTFNGETVARPFFDGANPDPFAVRFTLDAAPNASD